MEINKQVLSFHIVYFQYSRYFHMRHNLQWQFSHSYTGGRYLKMLMVGWPRSILSNLGQERPTRPKRISWSTPLHSSKLPARSAGNKIWGLLLFRHGQVKGLIISPSKALPHHWQGGHLDWEQREGPAGETGWRKVFTWCENLDGEENCADLEGRAPLVFEDVQADATQLVNVWVVDPGDEPYLHNVMYEINLEWSYF